MDLDEYLFKEKKKDASFTVKKFAEDLGVSHAYLNRLKRGLHPISAELACRIDKITNGEVDAWSMIKKGYEKRDKK